MGNTDEYRPSSVEKLGIKAKSKKKGK